MALSVLHRFRCSPVVAHVAPLVLFMLLSSLVDLFRVENSALPWYQRAPEHWVYPLQCLVVGVVLLWFREHYTLRPWCGLPLASVLGLVGIAIWVLPSLLYKPGLPAWCEWLGVVQRTEGFDPGVLDTLQRTDPTHYAIYKTEVAEWMLHSSSWFLTVLLRLFRMVVIVPLVEELFWRGFLMRYVQAGERDFRSIPFGQHTWRAFWIVTVCVTLIHQQADWGAAFVWGSLMYGVAVRTKSLGACVFMHAVGNLALGLYVLQTEQWGFW